VGRLIPHSEEETMASGASSTRAASARHAMSSPNKADISVESDIHPTHANSDT
jgi:hypothetical protein